ncbi:MAG: hypothetical protein RIC55_00195 [Pirellulaceae bacterium]
MRRPDMSHPFVQRGNEPGVTREMSNRRRRPTGRLRLTRQQGWFRKTEHQKKHEIHRGLGAFRRLTAPLPPFLSPCLSAASKSTMTILHSGSSEQYAANWDKVFGSKKKDNSSADKSRSAKKKSTKKKSTTKKNTAKKNTAKKSAAKKGAAKASEVKKAGVKKSAVKKSKAKKKKSS